MSLQLPKELIDLEANCGIFAAWMVLQHYSIQIEIDQLAKLCHYDDEDGTFSIGLAVGLKKLGFDISFYTDDDPNIHEKEISCYAEARSLNIPIHKALLYSDIQKAVEQGLFAIVYYDTLEGVGNHSLVYSIDEKEICFFDHFEAMPANVFEQQRKAEGICQQVIIIGDYQAPIRYS
ncbi:MAG: cysteine peptidase family C39 domain-containing protein [Acinetobacter sp.]